MKLHAGESRCRSDRWAFPGDQNATILPRCLLFVDDTAVNMQWYRSRECA